MNVSFGYQRTDIGDFPSDWTIESAESVVDPTAPICYGVVQVGKNVDDGVPIVAIKFVRGIANAPLHRASAAIERPFGRSRVKAGDVLISIKGTIGRIGVVPDGFEGNISRDLARLRPNQKILSLYLAYQLESAPTQNRISRAIVGTTRQELSIAALRRFEIPVPSSKKEQLAVADALSDVDVLLAGLERVIAKKGDLRQAAMQQLLTGQTRLPGFSHEWKEKQLGALAEVVSGGTPKTTVPSYWDGDIKWCTPTDITGCHGKYLKDTQRKITALGLSRSGAQLLPAGSLLLCSRATIGEIKIADTAICTNQGFKSLVCRPGTDNEYLYYKMLTMKPRLIERAFGSTFLEVSKANVETLEFKVPCLPEQQAIAAVLSDMDAELAVLKQRLDKTCALKQAMMQELLTGKTRLVPLEGQPCPSNPAQNG